MYLTDQFLTIDRAAPAISVTAKVQAPREQTKNRIEKPVPEAKRPRMPCIPLTDTQLNDYLSLISNVEALRAEERHDEARRTYRIATDILRTGAPSLE